MTVAGAATVVYTCTGSVGRAAERPNLDPRNRERAARDNRMSLVRWRGPPGAAPGGPRGG